MLLCPPHLKFFSSSATAYTTCYLYMSSRRILILGKVVMSHGNFSTLMYPLHSNKQFGVDGITVYMSQLT